MDWLKRKIEQLRGKAAEYQRDGVDVAARVYARLADELEEGWQQHGEEELSIAEAARESGYDESAIRKMRKSGRLPEGPNGGIRRRDLPRKPGHGVTPRGPRPVPPAGSSAATALGAAILHDMSRAS